MAKWDQYRDRFACLRQLWDEAEHTVKRAEQACERVCVPAIKELRYAGRRLIEIIHLIDHDAPDEEIQALLADAEFDCVRARHDAIDAIVSKVTLDVSAAKKAIGYDIILKTHPTFAKVVKILVAARTKIAASRKDRKARAAIYETVEKIDLPAILDFYDEFLGSEPIMVGLAKSERRKTLLNTGFGIVGVIGLIIAIVTLL